jgi:hypothetical protein
MNKSTILETFGNYLLIFNGDEEDLSRVYEIHDKHKNEGTLDRLVMVALDGTTDTYLTPERFLVENYDASLINHFLWEGKLTQKEQDDYLYELVRKFLDTGQQIIIENYKFTEEEPFYDYGGNRNEN